MERIIDHIERLLLQHDCVIIPDFGGFVLQSVPADYLEESHLFAPSGKEIVFNATLTHNDGLLTESYMQHFAVDFSKAHSLIRNDVAAMKRLLEDNAELQLGAVGLFFKEDDRLIFIPDKRSNEMFSISSYGLPLFNFLPISARNTLVVSPVASPEQHDVAATKAETGGKTNLPKRVVYNIPVTRTFLQVLAVAAAVIILFVALPTPVNDVNTASYSASFVPQEIMPKKQANEIVPAASAMNDDGMNETNGDVAESGLQTGNAALAAGNQFVSDSGVTSAPEPVVSAATSASASASVSSSAASASVASASVASAKVSAKGASGAKYYVIIGSYNTKARAQTHLNQLSGNERTDAGIVVKDGHVRVYARYFYTEKEAQSYRVQLRRNPKHANAWVYKGQ